MLFSPSRLSYFCIQLKFTAFGSTLSIQPVSAKTGFCDDWEAGEWDSDGSVHTEDMELEDKRLACLDDIMNDIENSRVSDDPWRNFPALKMLLRERVDWDVGKPMIRIDMDKCQKGNNKGPCTTNSSQFVGPKDVQSGEVFSIFNRLWKEENEPLSIKREQLRESYWDTKIPNILNSTWQ